MSEVPVETLQTWRSNLERKRRAISAPARHNSRGMTDVELRDYRTVSGQIDDLDDAIEPGGFERRSASGKYKSDDGPKEYGSQRARARVEVNEPRAYVKGNGHSYFRDLIRSQRGGDGSGDAAERLARHAQDVGERA